MTSREKDKQEEPKIVKIGEKAVDFAHYPPLTLGDRKRLKKEFALELDKLSDMSPEKEAELLLFLVRRIYPEVKMDDIDAVPIRIS